MRNGTRGVAGGIKVDFVAAIRIKINSCHISILSAAMHKAIRNSFRLHQGAPKRRPQMRRIKAAKNTVPIGVVALSAQHKRFSLIAGAEECLVVTEAFIEPSNFN